MQGICILKKAWAYPGKLLGTPIYHISKAQLYIQTFYLFIFKQCKNNFPGYAHKKKRIFRIKAYIISINNNCN